MENSVNNMEDTNVSDVQQTIIDQCNFMFKI